MQHHYYTWGYLTVCTHWICSWVQCLMICLCEAHFTQRSCLQLLFVQLDVLGSCQLLHPGRFPVCQGGVNTAQLHTGYDRLPVLHMLMTVRCQTWRCQLSWVSPPGFGQCWAAVTPSQDAGGEFADGMAVLPSSQSPEHWGRLLEVTFLHSIWNKFLTSWGYLLTLSVWPNSNVNNYPCFSYFSYWF